MPLSARNKDPRHRRLRAMTGAPRQLGADRGPRATAGWVRLDSASTWAARALVGSPLSGCFPADWPGAFPPSCLVVSSACAYGSERRLAARRQPTDQYNGALNTTGDHIGATQW